MVIAGAIDGLSDIIAVSNTVRKSLRRFLPKSRQKSSRFSAQCCRNCCRNTKSERKDYHGNSKTRFYQNGTGNPCSME